MKLAARHEICLALSLFIIQIAVKSVASNLSYENTNYAKINQDPSSFQQASAYRNNKHNYASHYLSNVTTSSESNKINTYTISRYARNYSQDKYKIGYDEIFPKTSQIKKWQVGRVSRKQYEIINMLWRKTKIFGDVESTTTTTTAKYLFRHHNDTIRNIRQPFFRFTSRPSLPSTTPSFIEFYYLDETDEHIKELLTKKHAQASTMREHLIRNHGNHKFVLSDSPMFSFRIRDANYKRPELTTRYSKVTNNIKRRKARTRDSPLTGFRSLSSQIHSHKFQAQQKKFFNNSRTSIKPTPNAVTSTISTTNEYIYDNETCPTTVDISFDTDSIANITSDTLNVTQKHESTTAYDKIKFFEMYDKLTPVPYYDEKGRYDMDNVDFDVMKENEVEHQVRLEHVDQSIGNEHSQPHKVKPAKKHIIDNYKRESNNQNNANSVVESKTAVKLMKLNIPNEAHSSAFVPNVTKQDVTKQPIIKLLQSESTAPQLLQHKKSQNVEWSHYPFAAAYVYEPLQVHCDAAGISSHWLITSGSCLSRHHKNPSGEGRSAFVTYCGVTWWNPERVAYVKYSLVHPRFNPRDKTRKHLYNIGLIQVVNSMASACNGWSSISLMSHQIISEGYGSTAKAVGWGLDRFDTRYSSSDLPKSPLSSYENQVFSHSCPGNVEYDKAKRLDEEGGIKNVYCLTLPPYLGEATDPVHGGLLLVGGKLVALYLQEERRPWGDQSAQYTGTWRLVPWILDMAREDDDADTFTLEI